MSQVKYCPRCKTPAALTASSCASCGRVFKTQFAPPDDDRTILGPGVNVPAQPSAPTISGPAVANYSPSIATGGPLDDTERNVSMLWTAIGLFASVWWFIGQMNAAIHMLYSEDLKSYAAYTILALIVPVFAISFLTMRLRRLYLAAPGQFSPTETTRRRVKFSLGASIGVVFLAMVSVGIGFWQVGEEQEAARKKAADQQARKEEAERKAEEWRQSITPRPAPQAGFTPPPAYQPDPVYTPSRPSRPISMPRSPVTIPRQTPNTSATWDPNTLPCGHQFVRFIRTNGREVGLCENGHRARIVNMRWVPEQP